MGGEGKNKEEEEKIPVKKCGNRSRCLFFPSSFFFRNFFIGFFVGKRKMCVCVGTRRRYLHPLSSCPTPILTFLPVPTGIHLHLCERCSMRTVPSLSEQKRQLVPQNEKREKKTATGVRPVVLASFLFILRIFESVCFAPAGKTKVGSISPISCALVLLWIHCSSYVQTCDPRNFSVVVPHPVPGPYNAPPITVDSPFFLSLPPKPSLCPFPPLATEWADKRSSDIHSPPRTKLYLM